VLIVRDEEYVDAEQLVPTEDDAGSTFDEGTGRFSSSFFLLLHLLS
jgi:hypothetical protein